VDATDEALVMQSVQHYFPRWKDEGAQAALGVCVEEEGEREDGLDEDEDESSTSTGRQSSIARGAKRGKVKTLCKTTVNFFSWHQKVLQARASPYCEEWDECMRIKALSLEAAQGIGIDRDTDCEDQSVVEGLFQQNTMFDMLQNALTSSTVEVEKV
jgi:hypothetical protein